MLKVINDYIDSEDLQNQWYLIEYILTFYTNMDLSREGQNVTVLSECIGLVLEIGEKYSVYYCYDYNVMVDKLHSSGCCKWLEDI